MTQHRLSALTRRMLDDAGLPVSEPMACGLGGGIGFLYAIFEYKGVDHPLLTIVAQHHPQPWLEAVAQHLNSARPTVELTAVTSSTAKAALAKLDTTLDAKLDTVILDTTPGTPTPAWITVGRGGLPWHDLPAGPLAEAEAADPYPVVVTRAEIPRSYLIDDADGAPHTLTADELAAAWSLHKKGKFAIETLAPADSVAPANPTTPAAPLAITADVVRASVATTIAHLTGPVIHHAFDTNFGFSGMRKLATELRDDRTKSGWRRRFGDEAAFGVGMLRLAECLTWAHTAAGGTRPLFAEFLREAAELLPAGERDVWREAATAADAAGTTWTLVADTAAAAATPATATGPATAPAAATDPTVNPTNDPATTFDTLATLVEQAIEHEELMVALLEGSLTRGA